ncbi:unnamed protein product [Adineta steineri]|uniref:Uncharacterized protein n=1 Tax=Adineta steineri TaxID=433720 RepID=A0A814CZR9_9BILA|nr:unnamed protein product [Adineta steineri]
MFEWWKMHWTKLLYPSIWDKWKQNATTVAGGNGKGKELNQLSGPLGIFIDKKKNIFIADYANHRIVEWKYNAKEGQIIAVAVGVIKDVEKKAPAAAKGAKAVPAAKGKK